MSWQGAPQAASTTRSASQACHYPQHWQRHQPQQRVLPMALPRGVCALRRLTPTTPTARMSAVRLALRCCPTATTKCESCREDVVVTRLRLYWMISMCDCLRTGLHAHAARSCRVACLCCVLKCVYVDCQVLGGLQISWMHHNKCWLLQCGLGSRIVRGHFVQGIISQAAICSRHARVCSGQHYVYVCSSPAVELSTDHSVSCVLVSVITGCIPGCIMSCALLILDWHNMLFNMAVPCRHGCGAQRATRNAACGVAAAYLAVSAAAAGGLHNVHTMMLSCFVSCQAKAYCLHNPPRSEQPAHSLSCSNFTAAAKHGDTATGSALAQHVTEPTALACAQLRQQMLLMHMHN
jgi:hypothetical protein